MTQHGPQGTGEPNRRVGRAGPAVGKLQTQEPEQRVVAERNRCVQSTWPPFGSIANKAVYLFVWNASLASLVWPLLFGYLISVNDTYAALLLLCCISLCYVPDALPAHLKPITIRRLCADLCEQYFQSFSVTVEGEEMESSSFEKNDTPTLYCFHPHGIFSMTWGCCFPRQEFHNVAFCFSDLLKFSPLFRCYSQILGRISGASKPCMEELMAKGVNLALIPGGFEEASLHSADLVDRIYIKKRFGFIKLCLVHGYCLRAVFGFGENTMYFLAFFPVAKSLACFCFSNVFLATLRKQCIRTSHRSVVERAVGKSA